MSSANKSKLKGPGSDLEDVLVERRETGLSGKLKKMAKGRSDFESEDSKGKPIRVDDGMKRPFLNNNNSQSSSVRAASRTANLSPPATPRKHTQTAQGQLTSR